MSDGHCAADAATITVCPQGPLLLRGDFEIVDAEGQPIEARQGPVALCRCGGSAIKPFCDGTHKLMKFERQK
ncbi:CDGSH iron-sulfur domain-containing protein [Glutamicibacter nicotianae]